MYVVAVRSAGEHAVYRRRHKLDVPKLLGGDVSDEVVVRLDLFAPTEIELLEGVVHKRGHLAKTPAHKLLDLRGGVRVWFAMHRHLYLQLVYPDDHASLSVGFIRFLAQHT